VAENGQGPRVFTVATEDFRRLSLRDLISASEASGVDVTELSSLRGIARIKGLAGMAWVIARQREPDLSYDQVLDGRVESTAEEEAPPLASGTGS
jgi:hypothetical protein